MSNNAAIEDAGEFIPYARKHLTSGEDIEPKQTKDKIPEKVRKIKLEELWAEPDWMEMKERGVDVQALSYMYIVYSNIRKSPREDHWGVPKGKWEFAYIKSIEILKDLFAKVRTLEDSMSLHDKYLLELPRAVPDYSEEPRHINNRYAKHSTGKCNSRKTISSAFHLSPKLDLINQWLVFFGWPENIHAPKYEYFPIELEDGTWRVAETRKSSYCWWNKPVSKQDAIEECIRKNQEQHPNPSSTQQENSSQVEESEEVKPLYTPKKKKHSTEQRIGPEYRKGNISAEDLIETFGFRGIQFGNALSNSERQDWLNNAFDAFHDLALVTGFKPGWIGLASRKEGEKSLGLAFGARGIGGTNAAAHYEIELNVINLTRSSGFGSSAHEWLHGLDARIGKGLSCKNFLTASLYSPTVHSVIHFNDKSVGERAANHIMAFNKIIELCEFHRNRESGLLKSSRALESQKRAKKYWTKRWELFARSGESYIQDKLAEHGIYSPWLVNGTLESECPPDYQSMWPYPVGDERELLNQGFDELFAALRR